MTRARTDAPEQLRRYRGWSFRVAVDTFNNEYQRSGEWLDLVEPGDGFVTGEDHIEEVGRRLGEDVRGATLGGGTDYREALAGARERFDEPVAGDSCDLLFWFTDGRHETDGDPSSFSNRERREIDDLCGADGTVADLRRLGVWINVIELTENRAPTAILPRLVGTGTGEGCEGLEGQVLGQVTPVSTASQLVDEIERVLYEVWPRTPIEFLPCSPPERKFTLPDDVEETRVFIDLTAVDDPDSIVLSLRPPGGTPLPIEFEERWTRIDGTGFLGWQPTRLHRELRAHQLSSDLYGTAWGDDQEWALICSGPGYERARIAIDEVETEKPRVLGLDRRADSLVGEVQPAPGEEEIVLISVRIGGDGPGSGRTLDLEEVDRRVENNGRFTISGIKGRIADALEDTGECSAEIEVSVTKWVVYGTEYRLWDIPGSAATLDVDVCLGPLPRIEVAEGVPAETVSVTADGGYLDAVLSIRSIMSDIPVVVDSGGWRCEVPRGVTQLRCDDIRIDVSDPPGLDTVVDLTVAMEARATEADRSEILSDLVPGFSVRGSLPDPDRVEVAWVDIGAIRVSAYGGLRDANLEIVGIDPPGVRIMDPQWRCAVPGGAREHACQPLISLIGSGPEQRTTALDLTIRARPTASDQPEWTYTFRVPPSPIPSPLPTDVRVVPLPRDAGIDPIPLGVVASPGAVRAVLSVESVEATAAGADTGNPGIIRSSWDGWRCEVPGRFEGSAADTECDPLHIEWEASQDSMVDLEIVFRIRTETEPDVAFMAASAGPFDLRVWEFSVFRSSLVRLLVLVLAIVIAVRVAAAWARRRWAPIASPHYFTEEAVLDDSDRLVIEGGGSPLIDPARYEVTAGLSSPRSSADIGGVRLRVLWWPLLLGSRVRIAAFSGSGDCVSLKRPRG